MGNKKQFIEALKEVAALYPNAAVLAQLAKLLRQPGSDLSDITALIRTEPALSLEIIRVSNSAEFAATGEVYKDIGTAVARIGLAEVQRVVGLIISEQLCNNDLEKYGISAQAYWNECVTVSVLTEALAKTSGLDPAEASTVGLLYAIGKVVINNLLEHFDVDVYWDPSIPVEGWEHAMVGFNYAEAGAQILRQWTFPPQLIRAIEFHLSPPQTPTEDPMVDVLHYAVELFKVVGHGCRQSDFIIPSYPPVSEKIDPDIIRGVVARAEQAFLKNAALVFPQ